MKHNAIGPTAGWIRGYRVAFALLTLGAIAYQLSQSLFRPNFRIGNFFSFFTIQSNLFAAIVLLWGARSKLAWRRSLANALVRGAAVLYLSITGVVYGLFLAGYQEQLQTTIPWVDIVLHRIMPMVMIIDWLIDSPHQYIPLRRALLWLIYPLAFASYSLIRGLIVGWYPYPFLNPREVGGYGGVGLYCLGIAFGSVLFVWFVVIAGRRFRLVTTR